MEGTEVEVVEGVGDGGSAGAVVAVFFGGCRGGVAASGGEFGDDLANTGEDTGFVFVAVVWTGSTIVYVLVLSFCSVGITPPFTVLTGSNPLPGTEHQCNHGISHLFWTFSI